MFETDKNTIIIVQGFGWTGSGAIVDFLLENESVKLVSNDEVPFFKVLIKLIDKAKNRKKIDIFNGENEVLFAGGIPSCYKGYVRDLHKMRVDRFFSLANTNKCNYKDFTVRILKKLNSISNRPLLKKTNKIKINQIVSEYLTYLNYIFQEESKILMYDNLLDLERLEILEGLDYSKIGEVILYVVDRDPRDQYFELYNMFKSNSKKIQYNKILHIINKFHFFREMTDNLFFQYCCALAFIYIYHKPRRLGYNKGKKILDCRTNFIHVKKVRFEDFVFNYNSVRDTIKYDIDSIVNKRIGGSSWIHGMNFNPKKSQQNVDIYKKGTKRKIYTFILDKVSKYNM